MDTRSDLQSRAHSSPQQALEGRRPYAPPQAAFVPLQVEERLMQCDKQLVDLRAVCMEGNLS